MTDKEELTEKLTKYILPAVFRAEDKLLQNPAWHRRLKYVIKDNAPKVAEEYCRAIAKIVIDELYKDK